MPFVVKYAVGKTELPLQPPMLCLHLNDLFGMGLEVCFACLFHWPK